MIGIYFSGTGNSKHAIEVFLRAYDAKANAFSIENNSVFEEIKTQEEIVFAYPVQYSTVPKILRDFIIENNDLWRNKKVLKRSLEKNKQLVKDAERKIEKAVNRMKAGKPTREGIGWISRMFGFLGQRLWFGNKTKHYSDKLKIDAQECVGCGKCARICPMKNIELVDGKCVVGNQCTMCYRCVNYCPKQAITLLGKKVIEQSVIEKYIK